MTERRVVVSPDAAYAVAVAELPRRAESGTTVKDALVVIAGAAGWGERAARVVDEGAAGVVVAAPGVDGQHVQLGVPVIVDRPWLRPDTVADALHARQGPPPLVLVELSSTAEDVAALLRDGVGWARVLAGESLELLDVRSTPRGILLQLRGVTAGTPATVLHARRDQGAPWLRAIALDSTRVEVTLELGTISPTVDRTDAEGRLRAPSHYESTARLALRRGLDAIAGGGHPTDLEEFLHDSWLAGLALKK